MLEIILAGVLYISVLICAGTKMVKDHERLVVFRLGKLAGLRGPGLVFVIPICEKYKKIDMQATPLQKQSLELQTCDAGEVRVNASCSIQVVDPIKFVMAGDDPVSVALSQLRGVVSQTCTKARASELIESSSNFNEEIGASMKSLEQKLGVILSVEIEKVELLAGPKS